MNATMPSFEHRGEEMWCEGVPLTRIAQETGTPCYVYSRAALLARWRRLVEAWPRDRQATIAYAARANPGRSVLGLLCAQEALVSVVSAGEMLQALRCGFSPGRMIWSGMGKSDDDLRLAMVKGIYLTVADSRSELDRMARLAVEAGTRARVSIRIGAGPSHGKVGIPIHQSEDVFRHAADIEGLEVVGVNLYLGTHPADAAAVLEPLGRTMEIMDRLSAAGVVLTILDLGGSLGGLVDSPEICAAVAQAVGRRLVRIVIEPGRALVGEAGAMLTRVLQLKETSDRRCLVVDAAMTDLPGPALFGSELPIVPVRHFEPPEAPLFDVAGPLFESNDVLGTGRPLAGVVPGDLLAILNTGAFGWSMSSSYCFRPRPPEVLVDGDTVRLVRRREQFQDMVRTETDVT